MVRNGAVPPGHLRSFSRTIFQIIFPKISKHSDSQHSKFDESKKSLTLLWAETEALPSVPHSPLGSYIS